MTSLANISKDHILAELQARRDRLRSALMHIEVALDERQDKCAQTATDLATAAAQILGITAISIYQPTRQARVAEARMAIAFLLRTRHHHTS
jgi:hypothetical protein